jgi:hypothetical protein
MPPSGPATEARLLPTTLPAAKPAEGPAAPDKLDPYSSRTLPEGLACLIRLQELGIEYLSLPPLRGVLTPVKVTGTIGGIVYRSLSGGPLIGDCRLALALHRGARFLSNLGVREMLFSSAYSYRLMPSGRLSQHAMGLAIDVHRVRVGDEVLDVRKDFLLGLHEEGCAGSSPPLNRIACLLRAWGVFDWVLTPDFDRAHDNHLHLDIYCLHRRRFVPQDAPGVAIDD